MIDEEVKKIFDEASDRCEQILSEHGEQLRAIAEYLLVHESMEKEVFDYFFAHGEFPAEDPKMARQARNDTTIERPALKISMTDGAADAAQVQSEPEPQTEPPADSGKNE